MSSGSPYLDSAFPELHSTLRVETEGSKRPSGCAQSTLPAPFPNFLFKDELYRAEFYPFNSPGVDPVFAYAWGRNTIICRPSLESEQGVEVLRWFKDEDERASLWSVAWALDSEAGDPLVCVTGDPAKIKVLNVKSGKLVTILVGHGARVNMMALSPIATNILASASDDHTIRIWNLNAAYRRDPCRIMLAGWGHKAEILYMGFHRSGRYAISAGNDTRICLWVLPDISDTSVDKPSDKTRIVHYPHFVTEEIHPRLVDCVEFYGDFILSKCHSGTSGGKILLWRIVGFSSDMLSPPASSAPTTSASLEETRSAFCSEETKGNGAFQVLLSFDMPNVLYHGHHFGLYHRPQENPVLAVGNSNHCISFWDLHLLEQGLLGTASTNKKHKFHAAAADTGTVGTATGKFTGPFARLQPHKVLRIPSTLFPESNRHTVRSVTWSKGGEWCVSLGDDGLICLMRWRTKEKRLRRSTSTQRHDDSR